MKYSSILPLAAKPLELKKAIAGLSESELKELENKFNYPPINFFASEVENYFRAGQVVRIELKDRKSPKPFETTTASDNQSSPLPPAKSPATPQA